MCGTYFFFYIGMDFLDTYLIESEPVWELLAFAFKLLRRSLRLLTKIVVLIKNKTPWSQALALHPKKNIVTEKFIGKSSVLCVPTFLKQKNLLYGNWINNTSNFKASFLKLHNRCIINACSFWENQNWWIVRITDVLFQSIIKKINKFWRKKKQQEINKPQCNSRSILGFSSFKPNMWWSPGQSSL